MDRLEITDDHISWISKPLDPDVGDRLQSFMKPVHVALAIKDAYLVLLRRQLYRFRNPNGPPSDGMDVLARSGRSISSGQEGPDPLSSGGPPKLQPSLSDGLRENMPPNTDASNLHPSSIISSLQRLPLPDLGPGSELYLASTAFKLRLNAYQARTPPTPRRGTFFMGGPVGLKGPNGFCRFEVRGEYDPASRQWRTVDMHLKDINFRKQRARGSR